MPSTNLANTSAFRQRSLRPGPQPCDITCQTQTPAAPQARHHSAHEQPPSLSSEPARATRMLGHTRPGVNRAAALAESAANYAFPSITVPALASCTFLLVATPQYHHAPHGCCSQPVGHEHHSRRSKRDPCLVSATRSCFGL